MAEQIEEIVKRGRWVFDETVVASVWIVRRNFQIPPDPDEELPEGWTGDAPPPYGPDGFYYSAVYELVGRDGMTTRSSTGFYDNIDATVERVENTLKGKVIWDH